MNNDNELLDLYEERVDKYIDEKRKTDDLFDYINRLEERIDKAIEYIETWCYDDYSIAIRINDKTCSSDPKAIEKLLDILKGSDKE